MRDVSDGRVLVVDDEEGVRDLCVESLTTYGYSVHAVSTGERAIELAAEGRFGVVLMDVLMPGLGGTEALKRIKAIRPEVQVIMITGYGSVEGSVEAMKYGASDYVLKPFNLEELALRVRRCLDERSSRMRFIALAEEFNSLLLGTVRALVKAVEAKSLYTRGHSDRVSRYASEIMNCYPLPGERRKETARRAIVLAGLLHDIGKIALPDSVLNSPGKVGEKQWELIRRHPFIGARIVSEVPPLRQALPGVVYHHCHFNNPNAPNCYPQRKTGCSIPLQARIVSVADTFDALTSTRPYRKALSKYDAVDVIRQEAGRQFDPEVVKAFLQAFELCFAIWKIGKE